MKPVLKDMLVLAAMVAICAIGLAIGDGIPSVIGWLLR